MAESNLTKPTTINELCDRMQKWANEYYTYDGVGTGEARNIRAAIVPLRELAGGQPVDDITAELVYDVQQHLLDRGLARNTINGHMRRLMRVIRWAAQPPRRWVGSLVLADIALLDSIKRGRTKARETEGVKPVAWELVEATAKAGPVWLSVALRVHWYTGARPAEIVRMRRSEITERDGMMIYEPKLHKNAYRGDKRLIVIGPQGQAVLRPWLAVCMKDRLFDCTSEQDYRRYVTRVCDANKIPRWRVGQIRHSMATRVRAEAGIEMAALVLGHKDPQTTLIYAEADLGKAADVLRRIG
ncbi:MAG: site-specific integrase [Phycisphaeraceae bacterium]|nr:site-specific integrase [Phycisphaeraceae bacterium]